MPPGVRVFRVSLSNCPEEWRELLDLVFVMCSGPMYSYISACIQQSSVDVTNSQVPSCFRSLVSLRNAFELNSLKNAFGFGKTQYISLPKKQNGLQCIIQHAFVLFHIFTQGGLYLYEDKPLSKGKPYHSCNAVNSPYSLDPYAKVSTLM